jgi:hypothetical protein
MATSPVVNVNPAALAALAARDQRTRCSYVGLLLAAAWVISLFSIVGATLGCLAGSLVERVGAHRAATGRLAFAAARGPRRVS